MTDGTGRWIAVWEAPGGGGFGADRDIFFSVSTDNGLTWSDPQALNTNATSDSGEDRNPQLATNGSGTWIVVWQSSDSLGGTIGTDTDILFSRSTDNGQTWSDPSPVTTAASSDSVSDERPKIATDGSGRWVVVWRSYEMVNAFEFVDSIQAARSINNGASWGAPVALSNNGITDTASDENPDVTADGAGNWVVVWESSNDLGGTVGTDRDIFFSRSTNNAQTWSPPSVLNSNAGSDAGNDVTPSVLADGAGHWMAVADVSDDRFWGIERRRRGCSVEQRRAELECSDVAHNEQSVRSRTGRMAVSDDGRERDLGGPVAVDERFGRKHGHGSRFAGGGVGQ